MAISAPAKKNPPAQSTVDAAYEAARVAALASFVQQPRIQTLWRALTEATDRLLQPSLQDAGLTLVAVGGYGRRELFPFSDVDVLILTPQQLSAPQENRLVSILHHLWDAHVPVSHAARSVADTVALAGHDATVASALMDARYVAGDRKQYLALKRQLRAGVYGTQPRVFVEAKLAERDIRHGRYGDSRFMLEPNVKEGKGGLRDLQTLNWLLRYCYGARPVKNAALLNEKEWQQNRQAYLFFSTVRALVHCLRHRADERLSFDLQPAVAAAHGVSRPHAPATR